VDLAAPGVDIVTTTTNSGYITDFGGTSAACAHVAGAAALLLAFKPEATPLEVKGALMQSVDQGTALSGKAASNGRLNVWRALQVITNTLLPPVVVGAFPASFSTSLDAAIEIWFNHPMERASVETGLQIVPAVTGAFEWSDEDRVVRLRLSAPLIRTNYSARLIGTAHDLRGNTIDGNFNRTSEGSPIDDFVWSFRFRPQNDDFINATILAGAQGSLKDDTAGASVEPDEPLVNGYGPLSLWYQWSATEDGWMTFDASASGSLDTLVAAYTGSALASLVPAAFDDDYGFKLGGRISFPVIMGTNYFITVASRQGKSPPVGSFNLNWYTTPPPGFTSGFSPGGGVPGSRVSLVGTNFTGATAVLFNGANATFANFSSNNLDLRISATVPADATDGPVTIRTPHGDVTSTNSFVVLLPRLLTHATQSGAIEISWAATATNLTLEATADLVHGVWTPVTEPLIHTNGHTIFEADVGRVSQFYRLKKN
jgi:hypothetical protein